MEIGVGKGRVGVAKSRGRDRGGVKLQTNQGFHHSTLEDCAHLQESTRIAIIIIPLYHTDRKPKQNALYPRKLRQLG